MMNICTKEHDLIGAIKHCSTLLTTYENVCPPNYPETAGHHAWRVELVETLLEEGSSRTPLPPKMAAQMSVLKQESAKKCLEMREICFGRSHPLTLRARAKVLK
tara:strand:+ start:224 stop:535 length:312 start_codon:yes stop_codon:yes gene_type:complete